MLASPNPTRLWTAAPPEDAARRRKLSCVFYARCLDGAVEARWTSWTCDRCPMSLAAWRELHVPPVAQA